MSISAEQAMKARVALQRFGLGPKSGGLAPVAGNPVAALKRELDQKGIANITDGSLPSYKGAAYKTQMVDNGAYDLFDKERWARLVQHMKPSIGFVERLVLFWSNHFSMSANKGREVMGMIGQFERDVIRANVLGTFPKMLKAVISHPTMVAYLDNTESIGPASRGGQGWGAGFNENLAREILELHTLGTDGGYSELDVTNFALILTGWSYVRDWEAEGHENGGTMANVGQFIYRKDWHQPGPIRLLGKVYGGRQQLQGFAALDDLALHPRTAEHLAYKMVKHFITDEPTPDMVAPLANAYLASGGNLKVMAQALIDLPAAWSEDFGKVRRPYELMVAQYRALGRLPDKDQDWLYYEPLSALRNLPWEWPTPDGIADENGYWLDPDGMTIRLDTALLTADYVKGQQQATGLMLANKLYGRSLSPQTATMLEGILDRNNGFVGLFMSPEFQRR